MAPWQHFRCAVTLGLSLGTPFLPVFAQNDPPHPAAIVRAVSLMSAIGTLKAPLLIAMNCPDTEENTKAYIAKLARHNSDPETVAALVNGSVAMIERIQLSIERGQSEASIAEETLPTNAGRLNRLASSVQNTGGLDFDGIAFGYRSDSLLNQMLSSISVLSDQRIPAYATAMTVNPVAAEALKRTTAELRLAELTQGQASAVNEKLRRAVAKEVRIAHLEWIALQTIIAIGLDHLTQGDGLPANFTLRKPDAEKLSEESLRMSGRNPDLRDFPTGYVPVAPFAGHPRSPQLQELQKTQTDLARVLAEENKQLASLLR